MLRRRLWVTPSKLEARVGVIGLLRRGPGRVQLGRWRSGLAGYHGPAFPGRLECRRHSALGGRSPQGQSAAGVTHGERLSGVLALPKGTSAESWTVALMCRRSSARTWMPGSKPGYSPTLTIRATAQVEPEASRPRSDRGRARRDESGAREACGMIRPLWEPAPGPPPHGRSGQGRCAVRQERVGAACARVPHRVVRAVSRAKAPPRPRQYQVRSGPGSTRCRGS